VIFDFITGKFCAICEKERELSASLDVPYFTLKINEVKIKGKIT